MDDKLDENKAFSVVFAQGIARFLNGVKDKLNNYESESLSLIRCLQIGKNPYKTFVYKADDPHPCPDFHTFYENLDKAERADLIS
jgi:hypothetical protein